MLIVNQAGTTIFNVDKISVIRLDKSEIWVAYKTYFDGLPIVQNVPIYNGEFATAMFEAIIEAASTGAQVIRLDKEC